MNIIMMVNSECNAGCKHCYLPYSGSRNSEDALQMVKDLQSKGNTVEVAGSETLLDPEYLKAYQQAGQKHLLTNGILLEQDKSLYMLLRQYGIEMLGFSIHFGIQEDLNAVPEDLVARVIKESKEQGFKVQVAATITASNYDLIEEMCERSIDYGADKLKLYKIVRLGRASDMDTLSPEQVNVFFEQIDEARKRFPKSVLEIRPYGNFGPRPGSIGEALAKQNAYCPAGKDIVAIDPQNNVYGCPFTMGPENAIGKYKDGEIIITRELAGGRRDCCLIDIIGNL